MAGRGATTFQKRQKEMQRKEKQQEKLAKRLEKKRLGGVERPEGDDAPQELDAELGPPDTEPGEPNVVLP
jgi:hypothetical protein